ncbi:MAG: phenylalanine--tRNA ligase subunit alpha [Caulobacterales bacterium]
MSDLNALESEILKKVEGASTLEALDAVRVEALGKSGQITQLMGKIASLPKEEKAEYARGMNILKDAVQSALTSRKTTLESAALEAKLASEKADATLPAAPKNLGAIHPVSQVMEEIIAIFADMGFAVAEGPDIEDDFHNFTALNFPLGHPARDMHDTFFFAPDPKGERKVLRTHTSPVQIRTMKAQKPPVRIIAPGRTYRNDSDQTHTPMFHQVEGLVVDSEVHMGHLKGCLLDFIRAFFEVDEVEARFRPHHFPFTEPSAEMDVRCDRSGGVVKIGQGDSWMEILGCGMVHPNVLRNCGYDPDEVQGFAFGVGVDRLAMLKYGMPDLRDFFAADMRWLQHYGFNPLMVPSLAGGLS